RVEGADRAITGIANQNGAAEWAEICAGQSNSPGSVQVSARLKPAYKIALRIENVDHAISGPDHRAALGGILQCIRYEELVADHLHSVRRITGGQFRILK